MTRGAVKELIEEMRKRYQGASRKDKSRLLDQFCEITGYHRKSAIRLMAQGAIGPPKARRGRPPKYRGGALISSLLLLWEASGYVCSKYLQAAIPMLMKKLEEKEGIIYDSQLRELLGDISASTIDRLLRPYRKRRLGRRYIGRRIASDLSKKIAVHTHAGLRNRPVGYAEIDLVFHCGMTVKGFHLTTLVAVDTKSSWTMCIPVWGKGKTRVQGAVARLRREAPYELKGIFTDNGSEFINETLYRYAQHEGLYFSHSRPYHKNDQPRVEQRNDSLVRRLVGYARYATQAALEQMDEVYRLACLQANFIRPTAKLLWVKRDGAHVTKHYDEPQSPYQRLLLSGALTADSEADLAAQFDEINPLALQHNLSDAIDHLWALETVDPASERWRQLQEAAANELSE